MDKFFSTLKNRPRKNISLFSRRNYLSQQYVIGFCSFVPKPLACARVRVRAKSNSLGQVPEMVICPAGDPGSLVE
jgi:hypothetical protein